MFKNILLQFTDLYNMTCVYCRVEVKLSVCIKATPSCIQKQKLKLCFCVWTNMTWPQISESTSPSKTSSHNSYQRFLVQSLLSTYGKLLPFLESIWFFFLIFKPYSILYVYSIQKLRQECLSLFLLL